MSYSRLSYRDYSHALLLRGIESLIRSSWRSMHESRHALRDVHSDYLVNHYRKWAETQRLILLEMLEIRRQAR